MTEQLLALNADIMNLQLWIRTKDGKKGLKKPRPIPRPGFKQVDPIFGEVTPTSINEMNEFLGWEVKS